MSPRQACCSSKPTVSNLRVSQVEKQQVLLPSPHGGSCLCLFTVLSQSAGKDGNPSFVAPRLQMSGPRELQAAEEGRMGMTACLIAAEVPWVSASVWRRAAILYALMSGRMDFAIAGVKLLTSKGQTDPQPTSCFVPH